MPKIPSFVLWTSVGICVLAYAMFRYRSFLYSVVTLRVLNMNKQVTAPPDPLQYEPSYCINENIIMHIQREQWAKAKKEIFGTDQSGFLGEDMEFYRKMFGTVELILDNNITKAGIKGQSKHKTKPHSLVYYRIFKNNNDNIRSMLLEHAFFLDDEKLSFKSHNCLRDDCVHRRVYMLPPSSIKGLYFPKNVKRYPFTFVRDPIDRFISAMTEIEYRTKVSIEELHEDIALPLTQPLGTQLRVQEFVQMLLNSGGSRKLFRDMKGIQIVHIAPMIGTLLMTAKVEGYPLHIYRLEDFDQEWLRLSKKVKEEKLFEIFNNRTLMADNKGWINHNSSSDPHKTTLAAKAFLGQASLSAFTRYGSKIEGSENLRAGMPPGQTRDEYQKVARGYLRALCRIYLTDFTCFNYTLPADCEDMYHEINDAVDYYAYLHSLSSGTAGAGNAPRLGGSGKTTGEDGKNTIDTWKDLLRLLLPKNVLRFLSEFVCFLEGTPECVVSFVHGEHMLIEEDPRYHEDL